MAAKSWDNATWTAKLADQFFSPDFSGEPVTFAVDPAALAMITGEPPAQAVEALASVVRAQVMPNHRFKGIRDQARRWQREGCDGPPPSLPLLGLTVLAVATNPQFGLYKPLRRLLDPDDAEAGMPGDYDDVVPELWEQLRWWLDKHLAGARGRSTITRHTFYVNIGYSTQQAMLRGSDRPLLYRFFRSIGLSPGEEEIVPAELRRALAIWAKHRLPRTERLHRLATDAALAAYAEALLQEIATRWDGRLRDPRSGSRAAVLRVMLELRPITLSFVAPARDGDPDVVDVADEEGSVIELVRDGAWYEPLPIGLEVTEGVLGAGAELSGKSLSFFHEGARAIPFRYDDTLYKWASTDRINFDEKHHLLVSDDIRAATVRWLAAEGFDGRLDGAATRRLPTGWQLIRDVRVSSLPAHRPPDEVQDLIGSSGGGARLRLVGGLRITALDRTYLTGGAPNVALPRGLEDRQFEILKDGFAPIERRVDGDEFDLCSFDLPEGDYEVANQTTRLPFTVVEGFREHPGPGVGSVRTSGAGGTSIAGLQTGATKMQPPVLVPSRGHDVAILLGARAQEHGLAEAPRWLESLAGALSWVALDAWLDFTPAWLLIPDGQRKAMYEAFPMAPLEPAETGSDTSWGRLITNARLAEAVDDDARQRWSRYLNRASEGSS